LNDTDKMVRVEVDLHHRVHLEAVKAKMTIKDWIAEAIREKLARQQERTDTD